jgi:hypothetical protein
MGDDVRESDPGLFDGFELRGKWWLPNAPNDRVHGTVTYSPAQRISLRLDGKFQRPELQNIFARELFKAECILGETVDEESVTLLRTFALPGSQTDTFTANALITGERFCSAADFLISGALVGYTNLDEWASVHVLKTEFGANPESFRVVVPTSALNLLTVRDAAPFQELTLYASPQISITGSTFYAQMRTFFDCAFQKPVSLREAEIIFAQLGNLLSILQGEGTYLKKARLKIPTSGDPLRTANLFRAPRTAEPPILSGNEMNLPLRELADDAPCLVGTWFMSVSVLDPVCDLLVGTYGRQSERTKFRALAQALESFHRGAFGGVYMSQDLYEPILRVVSAAIPQDLEPDFQQRLKSAVQYGFEYSLRTRLRTLLQKLKERTKEAVVQEKTQSFIDLIVRVRNYLTHSS